MLHLQLCVYQLHIWKNAHVPITDLPPATVKFRLSVSRLYGTFFKCRSIWHILDSRALFVQKYPAIRNVPDKFRHTFKLPGRSGSHFMRPRKAQRSPPLAVASRNIHQIKHPRFVYTCSLVSASCWRLVHLVVRAFCA